MQTFDPRKRLTIGEALEHPYISAYHDPDDEPSIASLDPDYFDFDQYKDDLTKAQLKELLFDEIQSFVPSI
jgi:mitogen-activated protein kinase 1/3